ncbi:CotH kinase family protein [Escherichia coli]|uniref:CotH kinase family protein n=1 Tax=Escherichia coli TaxID=562 RepID=UPI00211E3337|nr:CotH kinase family protein [Escherichia coli]MEA0478562.1 CotH kinase family protein [Escherichia coli]UUP54376.1 CotH kinase family protein [Escherichia coli]WFN30817.1 spore coat protein CotH [Escherichia coli]HDQ4016998.1 CotH kinase family protein [Escherichia coli]
MTQRYNTGNPRPSNSMKDLNDNALANDDYMNSEADTFIDRLGDERDTLRGSTKKMLAAGAAVVEETRQNLIPLSKQYMTLAAAQADIANIPEGSTTYYRSPDDSALAIEVMNVGGTLQPTGRKMPSQQAVDDIEEQTRQATDGLQRIYLGQQSQATAISDTVDKLDANEIALQRIYLAHQVQAATLSVGLAYLSPENQLSRLMTTQQLAVALSALDGFDPDAISVEARETYSEQYTFPKPGNIIKLFVTSPSGIPASKGEGEYYTTATIDIDGEILNIPYSSISVQGDSSAAYAKKNLNIGLYIDDKYDDLFTLKIGDCLPHDEWVFKANWIDHTNLRNLMSYRLWERMMASRDGWPKRDIDNYYVGKTGLDEMDTRATGYPVGYPCVMYINGDFYGTGALAIGKKKENYNISKNKAEQIMIIMGGWKSITTMYDNAQVTDSDTIEIKAPKTVSEETLGYLQTWDAFANLAQADFTQQAPEHLDTRNIVDFYLLLAAVGATDLFAGDKAKNAIFYTWDGTKWYFGPYDLDTTYGLHYNGTQISYAADSAPKTDGGTFWKKILVTYADELAARYAELRDKDIFSVNCLYDIAAGLSAKYTHELDKAEINKWPTKPSLTVTSRDQIFSWFNDRLAYLDNKFNYTR